MGGLSLIGMVQRISWDGGEAVVQSCFGRNVIPPVPLDFHSLSTEKKEWCVSS